MKIYLIITIIVIVCGAYIFGGQMAQKQCAINASQNKTAEITQTISNQRISDEKVYHTGVADIRRILHDKYTIAE